VSSNLQGEEVLLSDWGEEKKKGLLVQIEKRSGRGCSPRKGETVELAGTRFPPPKLPEKARKSSRGKKSAQELAGEKLIRFGSKSQRVRSKKSTSRRKSWQGERPNRENFLPIKWMRAWGKKEKTSIKELTPCQLSAPRTRKKTA